MQFFISLSIIIVYVIRFQFNNRLKVILTIIVS